MVIEKTNLCYKNVQNTFMIDVATFKELID